MDPSRGEREVDPHGKGYDTSVFSRGLDKLVPSPVARRAVTIDVSTDRDAYAAGEPITMTVTISNRLPVPIEVPISDARVWGWAVDGLTEATDERVYEPEVDRSLALRAGEDRRHEHTWHGRIRRDATERTTYEPLSRGTHELSVFLGTTPRKTATVEFVVQ